MQPFFQCVCVFQPIFLGSSGETLVTSGNQIVSLPSFVLTVFSCSTSYIVIIVLRNMLIEPFNAPAHWWPCAFLNCVSGRRRLDKSFKFLGCIHVIDLVPKDG